jgi:hypothetical protein
LKKFLAGLVSCACSVNSVAASPVDDLLASSVGTIEVTAEPYMAGGKLAGCQYVFKSLTQDSVYSAGGYLKVDGSISLMGTESKVGISLKIVVNELSVAADGRLSFTPSPPSRAYFIGDDYQTNLDALLGTFPSDTPGALFSVFNAEKTLKILTAAAKTDRVTIAFNLHNGNSDVILPIELDVKSMDADGKRTRSPEASRRFVQCALALMKDIP